MIKLRQWLAFAAAAPALWAQTTAPGRTWQIPALSYGPNMWSILHLANRAAAPGKVRLEVYRENGERLPMTETWDVPERGTREIRIDSPNGAEESCWAKVTELSEDSALEVDGSVEMLHGNAIEAFSRKAKSPTARDVWVSRSAEIEGKQVYFLNVNNQSTTLEFCATNNREQQTCLVPSRTATARFRVNPNQAIAVQVKKLRQKYFIAQSTVPGGAILLLFADGPGSKRTFSSDSSVEFETPRQ